MSDVIFVLLLTTAMSLYTYFSNICGGGIYIFVYILVMLIDQRVLQQNCCIRLLDVFAVKRESAFFFQISIREALMNEEF